MDPETREHYAAANVPTYCCVCHNRWPCNEYLRRALVRLGVPPEAIGEA